MVLASFRALSNRLTLFGYMRWQGTLWWEDNGYDLVEQVSSLSLRGYLASGLDNEQIKFLNPHWFQVPRQAILTATEGTAEAQKVALAVFAEVERNGGHVRGGVFYRE